MREPLNVLTLAPDRMIEVVCNDRLGKKVRVKCKYPPEAEGRGRGAWPGPLGPCWRGAGGEPACAVSPAVSSHHPAPFPLTPLRQHR